MTFLEFPRGPFRWKKCRVERCVVLGVGRAASNEGLFGFPVQIRWFRFERQSLSDGKAVLLIICLAWHGVLRSVSLVFCLALGGM